MGIGVKDQNWNYYMDLTIKSEERGWKIINV